MKRLLIIAPDSYPLNGAESIVNLKLLFALSRRGQFVIDLISKKNKNQDYAGNTLEELGIRLNSLHIIEVDNRINLKTLYGHLKSLFIFGTVIKGSHWACAALKVAIGLCEENKYDYVLTRNQSSPMIGYYLKKHFGVKWVATWNDPYPSCLYPPIYKAFLKEHNSLFYTRLINYIGKNVDKVIVPSRRLRDYLLPYYHMEAERTLIVPHVVIDRSKRLKKQNEMETLRLIHSGNISYPRDASVLLDGINRFVNATPGCKVSFDILGKTDETLDEQVKKYGLKDIVRAIPPVSYVDSLKMLDNYDVAVIVEAILEEGIFLPTKVSDFMQCGKTIFAISPQKGVLHDLYEAGKIGYFACNTSPDSVFQSLCGIYEDFKNNKLVTSSIPYEYTEKYVVESFLRL